MFARLLTVVTFVIGAHVLTANASVQNRAIVITSPPGAVQEAIVTSPRIASYRIDARFDPSTRTIAGDEVLTRRSSTHDPAATPPFHLYYNAWRNADSTWMRENRFADGATLERRPPQVIDFATVLENTSGLADNQPLATTVAGATVAWLVIRSFLSGGVIDRCARQRPTGAHGFCGACGAHFWRFLRLGAVAWAVTSSCSARYIRGSLTSGALGSRANSVSPDSSC